MERRFLIFRTRFASFRSSSSGVSHINSERNLLIITVILSMMIWTTREICTRGVVKDVRVIIFYFSVWYFCGKLFFFGMRAAWSISKLLITIVFLPVILLGMVFGGLLYLAFPILLIIGILSLFRTK